MQSIREMGADSSKPILSKELQTLSWWHHVVHDVGVNTVLLALASSEIPTEELPGRIKEWHENPGKLVEYIRELLAKAVEVRRDLSKLMELERRLEACSETSSFYENLFTVIYDAYSTLASMVPNNIKVRFLAVMLQKYTLLLAPRDESSRVAGAPGQLAAGGMLGEVAGSVVHATQDSRQVKERVEGSITRSPYTVNPYTLFLVVPPTPGQYQ